MTQTAAAQAQQFGYNNDFIGYFPLDGSTAEHGLLVRQPRVHQRGADVPRPRPRRTRKDVDFAEMTQELVDIEMAAHGGAVIEIARGRRQVAGRAGLASTTAASPPTRRWRSPARPPATTA